MIATPGAVLFAVPVPKNVYANNTPTPGPGFGSKINRIDQEIWSQWNNNTN